MPKAVHVQQTTKRGFSEWKDYEVQSIKVVSEYIVFHVHLIIPDMSGFWVPPIHYRMDAYILLLPFNYVRKVLRFSAV